LTLREALRRAVTRIPPLEARILLAAVTGIERAMLVLHDHDPLTPDQIAQYDAWVERIADGEPLAYILGRRAWYDFDLIVTPAVLVPRPETELLLERALAFLRQRPHDRRLAVDVGTGSGALAVGLAKHASADVHAVDVSAEALDAARANAQALGVNVTFHHGDLLAPVRDLTFDLIVANLPYIASGVLPTLAVARHEPHLALDGGADGLVLVRRLLAQAAELGALHPGGMTLLEIGAEQGAAAAAAAQAAFPAATVCVRLDHAGLDRIVEIQI
jgi:release factor glutamine methyltransferase